MRFGSNFLRGHVSMLAGGVWTFFDSNQAEDSLCLAFGEIIVKSLRARINSSSCHMWPLGLSLPTFGPNVYFSWKKVWFFTHHGKNRPLLNSQKESEDVQTAQLLRNETWSSRHWQVIVTREKPSQENLLWLKPRPPPLHGAPTQVIPPSCETPKIGPSTADANSHYNVLRRSLQWRPNAY